MRTPGMFLTGIGVYLPETVSVGWAVEQGAYPAERAAADDLLGAAVAGETPAPEMALWAAQEALKRCSHRPGDLDLLLYADTWHQGPEGWLPFTYLQHHLTGGDVTAYEIRQGCGGVIGGLELAVCYLRAEPSRRTAMVVAADNFGTPLMDRWRSGPFILGDAACALVLSTEPGFAALRSVRTATVPEAEEFAHLDIPLFPPGITVGRAGFNAQAEELKKLSTQQVSVFLAIHQKMVDVFETTLADAGITADQVTRVAVVNNSREMVEQRHMGSIGLDPAISAWEHGRTVGHCGASDPVIALDHLLSTGELTPGDHFAMFTVGPGVVISCAIVTITATPPWMG